MEFEIKDKRQFNTKNSEKVFSNYKFFYNGEGFWISEKTFEKHPNLLTIEGDKIILKEPLEEFYEVILKKNEKGEFKTILPKIEIEKVPALVSEPEVAYKTKVNKLKKPVKKTKNQKIEDFFNMPLPKTDDKKKSISKTETSLKEPKQPEKQKNTSRQSFISGLMPHLKTTDDKLRNKYFELLNKEIESMPKMEDKIMRELEKIKERIGGKTRGMDKDETQEAEPETGKNKFDFDKLNHNPKFTSDLLKKFKYKRDDTGFKYLVHKPTDVETFSIEEYNETIKKSENYFKEIQKLNNLHPAIYLNIKELIELMAHEGKTAVEKTKKHPFDNIDCDKIDHEKASKVYKNISNKGTTLFISWIIKNFKKNYRFSHEPSESSVLKDLIINVFNQKSKNHLDSEGKKVFVFNEYKDIKSLDSKNEINEIHKISMNFMERFDTFSNFFTWVKNIKFFLSEIADDILKHSNYDGCKDFINNEKEVFCSIDRAYIDTESSTKITLSILDKFTISKTHPNDIYNAYKDKLLNTLKCICDWSIHYDMENGDSYIIQFLPELPLDEAIKKHSKKAGGFKYLLTFYD